MANVRNSKKLSYKKAIRNILKYYIQKKQTGLLKMGPLIFSTDPNALFAII